MQFQLEQTTQVNCTNANTRTELHGDERVRAIDLTFCLTGENTLLDQIQPGLREHHFFNNALKAGQEELPGMLIPLPNLRFPKLTQSYHFAKGERWRGYRFVWDWGTEGAHVDFRDAVLSNLHYELIEGGSCKVFFTVQYNGEELANNDLYGELAGLASMGEVYIQLLPPVELQPAKKGYRAGKPDTPAKASGSDDDDSDDMFPDDEGGDGEGDEGPAEQTPEGALAAAVAGEGDDK